MSYLDYTVYAPGRVDRDEIRLEMECAPFFGPMARGGLWGMLRLCEIGFLYEDTVMKTQRSAWFLLINLLLAAALLAGCSGGNNSLMFQTEALQTGDLTANLVANGKVRPSRAQDLIWKLEGEIGDVLVDNMDEVREGQKLAELKASSLPAQVISARAELLQAEKDLESLQNNSARVEQAALDVLNAEDAVKDAERKRNTLSPEKRKVGQAFIDGARADYLMAEENLKQAETAFNDLSSLPEENLARVAALKSLAVARQQRDAALAQLNYLLGHPSELEIATAETELALAKARLAEAQRTYADVKNGVPENELAAAQARVDVAQATLNQAFILAPFDGRVTYVSARSGERIQPGELAAHIEDAAHLYIDTEISEIDINRMKLGQPVAITFDAIYGKEYAGKVTAIGGSGQNKQGVVVFPVTVELLERDEAVKSGMTAALSIQVDSVSNVLMVPNRAVRMVDGKRVVFIQPAGGVPQKVEIVLGVSSETYSQVLEGDLKAGDLVVMNPDLLIGQMNGMTVQ